MYFTHLYFFYTLCNMAGSLQMVMRAQANMMVSGKKGSFTTGII